MSRIMPDIDELKSFVTAPQDVAVITHRNPDGDALGSSLALAGILRKMYHSVSVITPSEYPVVFEWMPKSEDILIYDIEADKCKEVIKNADFLCCLDFNGLDRIDKLGEFIYEVKEHKNVLLVDHHIDPEPFADIIYSNSNASSTCELIYMLSEMCDWEKHIDKEIATCLYTGLLTDTGSFHHGTSPQVFHVCSKISEQDIDAQEIHDHIFKNQTEKQMRLLGHCLFNRMEIIPEIKTGIIKLRKSDYEEFNIVRGDTEGIVNYLLKIKEVHVAAFITEQPTIVKLSLRSKGDISVQQLARDHFKGGGHKNAAGGAMYGRLNTVVEKFKRVVPFYIPTLKSFNL